MKEQSLPRQANRREMLRLSGMGVLGGVAGSALTLGRVQAADIAVSGIGVSYASWIHGHSMQIEHPEQIVSQWRAGFSITVEGKPGTANWFHFAIPTPVIINDVRLKADSVIVRFRTGSLDAFVQNVHVYDGETRIAEYNNLNLSQENLLARFVVPNKPAVQWGLGISIGVGFGMEAMDHHMEFISAGCDFVV